MEPSLGWRRRNTRDRAPSQAAARAAWTCAELALEGSLARISHQVLAAKRGDRSEKAAPRSAGPRRSVPTSQGRAPRYGLRSKRIADFGRNRGEKCGLALHASPDANL